jgi:hypothetical protein
VAAARHRSAGERCARSGDVSALNALPAALVNNALVAARVAMYQSIVTSEPKQIKFLHGWINRAVSFSSFASANV